MVDSLKSEILNLLAGRAPNWVRVDIITRHLSKWDAEVVRRALDELYGNNQIEKDTDRRNIIEGTVDYYRSKSITDLPIRRTIRVGDVEVPRLLSCDAARFLPENYNELIEQQSKHAESLKEYAGKLKEVEEKQKSFWAKIIGVFAILAGVLAIILSYAPKSNVEYIHYEGFWRTLGQNFAALIPFCLIIIMLGLITCWIIKK